MTKRTLTSLTVFALSATLVLAATPTFLKLTVQEKGYQEPNVKINVPLSLLDAVSDAITDDSVLEIDKTLDKVAKEGIDLRKLWDGVKKLGPTDFVEITKDGEYVKVWKDRKAFRLTVTEQGQKDPKVLVTLPLKIVEQVVGDGTKPITLKGILQAIRKAGPMQFVEVHDQGQHVKIWIE